MSRILFVCQNYANIVQNYIKTIIESYIFYDQSMLKWHTNTIKQPYIIILIYMLKQYHCIWMPKTSNIVDIL